MPNEDGGESNNKKLEDHSEADLNSDPNQVLNDNSSSPCEDQNGATGGLPQPRYVVDTVPPVINIVILQPEVIPNPEVSISKNVVSKSDQKICAANTGPVKKDFLARTESCHEECRICQQQTEEPLIDIGCLCRGELAKAHRSCIEIWFRTRGSNKCEICQQTASNVPSPQSQPSTNYWVWRVDPTYGGRNGEHGRSCVSPLWIAFAILIGGLLLDVLISVSLGVSALPVNIIIGVLIVLGLGTAIRLALECCQDWDARRNRQRADMTGNTGFRPTV